MLRHLLSSPSEKCPWDEFCKMSSDLRGIPRTADWVVGADIVLSTASVDTMRQGNGGLAINDVNYKEKSIRMVSSTNELTGLTNDRKCNGLANCSPMCLPEGKLE